jgi:hypothetical protein
LHPVAILYYHTLITYKIAYERLKATLATIPRTLLITRETDCQTSVRRQRMHLRFAEQHSLHNHTFTILLPRPNDSTVLLHSFSSSVRPIPASTHLELLITQETDCQTSENVPKTYQTTFTTQSYLYNPIATSQLIVLYFFTHPNSSQHMLCPLIVKPYTIAIHSGDAIICLTTTALQ